LVIFCLPSPITPKTDIIYGQPIAACKEKDPYMLGLTSFGSKLELLQGPRWTLVV